MTDSDQIALFLEDLRFRIKIFFVHRTIPTIPIGFHSTVIDRFIGHKIRMSHLPLLNDAFMEELLPCIGDRITLMEGIKSMQAVKPNALTPVKELAPSPVKELAPTPVKEMSDPNESNTKDIEIVSKLKKKTSQSGTKKDFVRHVLRSDEAMTVKLKSKLLETLKDWNASHKPIELERLLNVNKAGLNCPFCPKILNLKFKKSKKKGHRWNINNFRQHLSGDHAEKKSKGKPTNRITNAFLSPTKATKPAETLSTEGYETKQQKYGPNLELAAPNDKIKLPRKFIEPIEFDQPLKQVSTIMMPTTETVIPITEPVIATTESVVRTTELVSPTTESVIATTESVILTTVIPTSKHLNESIESLKEANPETRPKPSTKPITLIEPMLLNESMQLNEPMQVTELDTKPIIYSESESESELHWSESDDNINLKTYSKKLTKSESESESEDESERSDDSIDENLIEEQFQAHLQAKIAEKSEMIIGNLSIQQNRKNCSENNFNFNERKRALTAKTVGDDKTTRTKKNRKSESESSKGGRVVNRSVKKTAGMVKKIGTAKKNIGAVNKSNSKSLETRKTMNQTNSRKAPPHKLPFHSDDPIVKATHGMLLTLVFGWVKFTENSRFVPAFRYRNRSSDGRYRELKVLATGYTADYNNPISVFKKNIAEKYKGKSELAALTKLNTKYHFSFE